MSPEMVNGLFALGGAALGAIIAAAFSWYQHKKTRERKELTILTSRPSNLIAIDSSIAEIVKITVSDHQVPSVYTFEITVHNSGNQTISDIDIPVETDVDGRLLGAEIVSTNFAEDAEGCTVMLDGPKTVRARIGFLNSGDEIELRVLASDKPVTITPGFRQPDVSCQVRTNYDSAVPDVLSRAILDVLASNVILDASMSISSPQYRRWRRRERDER